MESVEGKGVATTITSNVVITETQRDDFQAATSGTEDVKLHNLSTSEDQPSYVHLTDRFTFWKTYTWKDSDLTLKSYVLPIDFINSLGKRCDMPIFVPFHMHQYWRGDIEVKMVVNSNKFQSGLLMVSWLYGGHWMANKRDTLAECFQQPHVLINAGACNSGTLYIPYQSFKAFVPTRQRHGSQSYLSLGVLNIFPMTGIHTAAGGHSECTVSIFIRFPNSRFTGLIDGSIAVPEMLRNILNTEGKRIASTVIDSVTGLMNCDNPPEVKPPMYVVPTAAHSWSIGRGLTEPIHRLCLDANKNSVGVFTDLSTTGTDLKSIITTEGLLNTIIWSSSDNNFTGHLLWSTNVHPQCDKGVLPQATIAHTNKLASYVLPPVGVISSLYEYWRGSLVYTFRFVSTAFHTGSVICAYIPGIDLNTTVSLDQARNSAHVEFKLHDQSNTFEFQVPFISDKPWWSRRYGGPQKRTEKPSPSVIAMYVVNPLIVMESISPTVQIIVSIKAGDDFEFSVPVQPSIGLGFNDTDYPNRIAYINFKEGYRRAYVGTWHSFARGLGTILRWGTLSDQIAQLETPVPQPPEGYYRQWVRISATTITYRYKICADPKNPEALVERSGSVRYILPYTRGQYTYAIPFCEADKAVCAWIALQMAYGRSWYKKDGTEDLVKFAQTYVDSSAYMSESVYRAMDSVLSPPAAATVLKDYIVVDREIGEENNVLQPTRLLGATGFGMSMFGECFEDFKDYLRRYQLVYDVDIKVSMIQSKHKGIALLKLPVVPSGFVHSMISHTPPVWNAMREGPIPVLLSAFAFFRGGLRYRLLITNYNGDLWVQHHPDKPCSGAVPCLIADISPADRYRNHGYAFYVQDIAVNNVLELEVPFYQPGVYGILQQPEYEKNSELEYYTSLGELIIGVEGRDLPTNVGISVYYSVADDFNPHVFIGFPRMIFTDEVSLPEMDFNGVVIADREMFSPLSALGSFTSGLAGSLVGKVGMYPLTSLRNSIKEDVRNETIKTIKPTIEEIGKDVMKGLGNVENTLTNSVLRQAIINALTNFTHVAMNPSPSAIAVAVISMVSNFIITTIELVMKLQEILTSFLNKYWTKFFHGPNEHQEGHVMADGELFFEDMSEKEANGFLGIIFSAIAASLGLTLAVPHKFPSIMRGVRECLNVCNASIVFFRNITDTVVYCYRYCCGHTSEEVLLQSEMEREAPDIKDWVAEAMKLLDPRLKCKIVSSPQYANRLFDACMYGGLLIKDSMDLRLPSGRTLYDIHQKLCKLRDDVIEMGNHPDVRMECFPIWVCGDEGIGKTFLTQDLCKHLLQSIEYRTEGSMIYWLSLGSKYWNGIKNQPVIARDEAYAISGAFGDEEVATHLAICSSSILNPPMANLDEKNKRLNPLIYYMNSNQVFPSIPQARHVKAIYRRRKVLVRVALRKEIKDKYPNIIDAGDLPKEELIDFKHLEFSVNRDPKDAENQNVNWSPVMTYMEFKEYAIDKFKQHYFKERENFKQRMQDAYCLNVDEIDEGVRIPPIDFEAPSLRERVNLIKKKAEKIYLEHLAEEFEQCEDSYYWRVYNKFFGPRDSAQPESDDSAFYTYTQREKADILMGALNIDRAACLKLGTHLEFDNFDLDHFKVSDEFLSIMQDESNLFRYWVGMDTLSALGLELPYCSTIANNTGAVQSRWMELRPQYIHEVSGVEQLRWLVYWRIREQQYYRLKNWETEENLQKIRRIDNRFSSVTWTNIHEVISTPLDLDHAKTALRAVLFQSLVRAGYTKQICIHSKVWSELIINSEGAKYDARREKIIYTDYLGLKDTITKKCDCADTSFSQIANNILFNHCCLIIWNKDHGSTDNSPLNPFAQVQHELMIKTAKSWLASFSEWLKDWWECVAIPGVHTILRFIYMHLYDFIKWLLVAYAVFKVAQWVRPSSADPEETVLSSTSHHWRDGMGRESEYNHMDGAKPGRHRNRGPSWRENAAEHFSILSKKVENNTVFLIIRFLRDNERREIRARCLGLRNRLVLCIRHYLEEFKIIRQTTTDVEILIEFNFSNRKSLVDLDPLILDSAHHLSLENQELTNFSVIELPHNFPQFKNIISSIPTMAEHKNVGNVADFISIEGRTVRSINISTQSKLLIAGDKGIDAITVDMAYKYPHHGGGLCGSLLIAPNLCKGNPGIIGMHVAGRAGIGYAEPLSREWFEDMPIKYSEELIIPPLSDIDNAKPVLDANLIFFGCVDNKFAHNESGKSKIVPSLLHEQIYPVVTEINPLKPNDPRQGKGAHPLKDGCENHGLGFVKHFPVEHLERVSLVHKEWLIRKVKPITASPREFSLEEAICGNALIEHCDPLKWGSSEGFPLKYHRPPGVSDKKYLFDLDETAEGYRLKGVDSRLTRMMQEYEVARLNGQIFPPVYEDCLKDYRLDPEKCKVRGKTRIFSISPVWYTIEFKKVLGPFFCGYKKAKIECGHGIGINPDSVDWTTLVDYLHEMGDNIVTGDYTNFGPTASSQVVNYIWDDIRFWHEHYGYDDDIVKKIDHMYYGINNPIHLCGNTLYQVFNGIPSGSPATAEINSMINLYYIMLAYIGLHTDNTLKDFFFNVRVVTYGDDFIMSVSKEALEWFNCVSISSYLIKFGIKLTSADKGSTIIASMPLSRSTFLKRGFIHHPTRSGIFLAPLEEKSITECVNWCHKQNDMIEATREVARASVMLAYGRGPDYFNLHRMKILAACIDNNIDLILPYWFDLDKEFFG